MPNLGNQNHRINYTRYYDISNRFWSNIRPHYDQLIINSKTSLYYSYINSIEMDENLWNFHPIIIIVSMGWNLKSVKFEPEPWRQLVARYTTIIIRC